MSYTVEIERGDFEARVIHYVKANGRVSVDQIAAQFNNLMTTNGQGEKHASAGVIWDLLRSGDLVLGHDRTVEVPLFR